MERFINVIISAELMMVGHCSLSIRKDGDGIFAFSSVFSDGGEHLKGYQKHIDNKPIDDLLMLLEQYDFAIKEDPGSGLYWAIGIYDGDKLIKGIEPGYYEESYLIKIIGDIYAFLGKNKTTSIMKKMIKREF